VCISAGLGSGKVLKYYYSITYNKYRFLAWEITKTPEGPMLLEENTPRRRKEKHNGCNEP